MPSIALYCNKVYLFRRGQLQIQTKNLWCSLDRDSIYIHAWGEMWLNDCTVCVHGLLGPQYLSY